MKKHSFLFNCITVGFFAVFVATNLFVTNGEYSPLENRYLQGAPEFCAESIANRTFMTQAEACANDQLMLRDFFVSLKSFTERITGRKENNGVYFSKDGYLIEKPAELNEELVKKNLNAIKEIDKIGRYEVSFCLIPQAFEVLKDKLPSGVYTPVIPNLYQFAEKSLDSSSVKFLNTYDFIDEKSEEYVYYKTDHHQTSYGSYLVYTAMKDICGYEPVAEQGFNIENVSDKFYGTTYSKALLKVKPDTVSVYKNKINTEAKVEFVGENKSSDTIFFSEHLENKDKYSYYLDGNHGITVVRGNAGTGESIALFKDSYAHSIAPFLINNYDSVHLIDMRYYQDDPIKYLTKNGITKVLFLYGTSTFMTDETIAKIAEYAKNSPYANFGLVKECPSVGDGYFDDAVFLGDSLTVGFQSYSGFTGATFLCRTSMSVGGVFNTESDGSSLVDKVKAANPGKIYIMLGVNEEISMSNKENVMNKFVKLIDKLKQDNPDALIYLQSIFPVSQPQENSGRVKNDVIYSYNDDLIKIAGDKQIYYVDVYNAVTDENGYLRNELTFDGIHLGSDGCKLWADYLKTHAVKDGTVNKASGHPEIEFSPGQYDLEKIAAQLREAVTFEGDIGQTQPAMLLSTHGIAASLIQNAYGMVGGGASAEEIALFELKNADDANKVKELLKKYTDMRTQSFESYIPSQVPKLKNAFVYSDGKLVALVVATETGDIKNILKNIR